MVRWIVVAGFVILIGARWYWNQKNAPSLVDGQRVQLSFTVQQQPQIRYGQEELKFRGITIQIPQSQDVNYGDYIQASGTIRDHRLDMENFQVSPGVNSLGKQINTLRLSLIGNIKKYLPPDEAGLAAGMLFGGTQDMTAWQVMAYRRAGLSHIVAASGYNVTLVAAWAAWLVNRLFVRKITIPLVILIIILYAVMAGGSASVVRAAVMGIITALGLILGRETDVRWVLLLSVLTMLAARPEYLVDIGFQLSVAATAGLVFFNPRSLWWTSIAAQIATMPLILHHFGNLSLVAPLANLLILWTVPIIMQISALAAVTGGFLSLLAWPLLKWCNLSTYYLSSLRFSSLTVAPMGWSWVIGYYLVLYLVYKLKFETKD